ncbi:hypothetical protein [Rubrivirga sp.]|uniref:hypothetical protein n=1 Tax=Rubrivirga sp. TaxID=1885344 RepID=UPI003B52E5A4
MRRTLSPIIVLVASLGLASCSSPNTASADGDDQNVLTAENIREFAATNGGATALDLVRRHRSFWLRVPATPTVYQGTVVLGGPEALDRLGLSQVQRLEFLDPRVARNRYGVQNHPVGGGGAILVTLG